MTARILFVSPYTLFDTTNGAAISMRMLLQTLARNGFECSALTGTFSPLAGDIFALPRLQSPPSQHSHYKTRLTRKIKIKQFDVLSFVHQGMDLNVIDLAGEFSHLVFQELAIKSILPTIIRKKQPRMLLISGRISALPSIVTVAERCGIPVAVYLATAREPADATILSKLQHVLVPSCFLARYYQDRYGIHCSVLRPIIEDPATKFPHSARFVTMVNPAPEKGVTMFYGIAKEALRSLPSVRFQVVEGRWTKAELIRSGLNLCALPNVAVVPNAKYLAPALSRTSILIHPSYWEEAFGRTIVEAQSWGIPVLASRRGGIPEALNGGGFLFDIPDRLISGYMRMPSRAAVKPWLNQLTILLSDTRARRVASNVARRAAAELTANSKRDAVKLFSLLVKT